MTSIDLTKFTKYNYNLLLIPDGTVIDDSEAKITDEHPLKSVFMNTPTNYHHYGKLKYYFQLTNVKGADADIGSLIGSDGDSSNDIYFTMNNCGLYNYNNFNNDTSSVADKSTIKSTDLNPQPRASNYLLPILFIDQLAESTGIGCEADIDSNPPLTEIPNIFGSEIHFGFVRNNGLMVQNLNVESEGDDATYNCRMTPIHHLRPVAISFNIFCEKYDKKNIQQL